MSETLDLTGLVEKVNRKGKVYYEDNSGAKVAKVCSICGSAKKMEDFGKQSAGFLGKRSSCLICHNSEGRTWKRKNEQKIKETSRKYLAENKEKIREYRKRYRQTNKEKIAMSSKRYREENKEKISESWKRYREEHKEERREYERDYRERNKESRLAYNRKWENRNREKVRMKVLRRRARKAVLPDDFGELDTKKTLEVFNHRCALTGELENRTWDHAVPINSGRGGTTYGNMYPLRGDLNSSKQDSNIFEWFKANRQRFELSQGRFDALIEWLAETNDMTVAEYTAYVYECHGENTDSEAI